MLNEYSIHYQKKRNELAKAYKESEDEEEKGSLKKEIETYADLISRVSEQIKTLALKIDKTREGQYRGTIQGKIK